MKSRDLKKLPSHELEKIAIGIDGYKPKGHPFPLFVNDLHDDTIGWSGEDRYRYIVLLDHIFHKGGFIPDDLDYIAEVSGINRARNWREKAEKLRFILIKSEKKVGFLTQKKVMCEVISAFNRSNIASLGGVAKSKKSGADSTSDDLPLSPSLPIPVKEEGTNVPSYSETFLEFWNLYPKQRKDTKEKSHKAYTKALKEKRGTEAEILDGLRSYVMSRDVAEGMAKGTVAWLNNSRWTWDYSPQKDERQDAWDALDAWAIAEDAKDGR